MGGRADLNDGFLGSVSVMDYIGRKGRDAARANSLRFGGIRAGIKEVGRRQEGEAAPPLELIPTDHEFYGRVGATSLPPAVTMLTWNRFFDEAEPVHALVAESDGKLVGLVHYLFHRSTTSITPICYLQDLFTCHDARGRGVGSALIASVMNQARLADSHRVYWQTHEANSVARRLYDRIVERCGFLIYRLAVE